MKKPQQVSVSAKMVRVNDMLERAIDNPIFTTATTYRSSFMGEAIASSNIEGLLNVFSVETFVMLVIFQSVIDKLHERVDYF